MDTSTQRYQIHEQLGRGGFGAVYRATDRTLGREVAIKRLLAAPEGSAWRRFEREARVLAGVEHPHLLRLYDCGVSDGQPYLVTEYLEGESLDRAAPEDPLAVMMEVAEGLEELHRRGLIHRDVKPANILRTRQGRTVLLDLGLVAGDEMATLTETGRVVGTLSYLAPELLRGEAATPACDWYAWGVTLEELLEKAGASRGRALAVACQSADPAARPAGLEALRRQAGAALRSQEPRPRAGEATVSMVGPAPVPAPRRRPWPALVLGVVGLAWWAWPKAAPTPLEGSPAIAATPVPAPGPGPLGADLGRELRDELDAALQLDLEVPIGRGETRAIAFMEAASLWGVGALDQLPRHRGVLEWMAGGGDLRALTQDEQEALAAYDDSLVELRLPPAYGPLLELTPQPMAGELPAELPPEKHLDRLDLTQVEAPGRPWAEAAFRRFHRARVEHAQVVAASSHFAESNEPANLFAEHPEDPGAVNVIRLRSTARGRDTLRDMVGAGEAAVRAYLVAARRALDHVPDARADRFAGAYSRVFRGLSLLFTSSMITASRDRLFGTPPVTAAAKMFEVRVLWMLRIHRDRCLVPHGRLVEDILAARRRAVDATAAMDPKVHSEEVYGLLDRLDAAGEAGELADLWAAYKGRLVGLPEYHWANLAKVAERRGLPPIR